jgi:hypothetical protein
MLAPEVRTGIGPRSPLELPLAHKCSGSESCYSNTTERKHKSDRSGFPTAMQLPRFVSFLFTIVVFTALPSSVNSAFAPQPGHTRCFSPSHRKPLSILTHQLSLVSSSVSLQQRQEMEMRRVNNITRDHLRMSLALILNAPILFIAWLGYSSLWKAFLPSHDARTTQ